MCNELQLAHLFRLFPLTGAGFQRTILCVRFVRRVGSNCQFLPENLLRILAASGSE
jgi:hypothetical protein